MWTSLSTRYLRFLSHRVTKSSANITEGQHCSDAYIIRFKTATQDYHFLVDLQTYDEKGNKAFLDLIVKIERISNLTQHSEL